MNPTPPMRRRLPLRPLCALAIAWMGWIAPSVRAAEPAVAGADRAAAARFHKEIEPILNEYCSDCHGGGMDKGNVTLDEFDSDEAMLHGSDVWWRVLKNVRAGVMPPPKKPRPSEDELRKVTEWIKYGALGLDPQHPDPGRVTMRRLNRVEYRNTIRDLLGVEFNTTEEFPPDDTGYGFDTIGDVLSVSPLLLEKYMQAAEKIIAQAMPAVAKVVPETVILGPEFHSADNLVRGERFTFYQAVKLSANFKAEHAAKYRLNVELKVHGNFDFDPGTCTFSLAADGEKIWHDDFRWQDGKKYDIALPVDWAAGEHRLTFELTPTTPKEQKKTSVDMQIVSLRVEGPMDEKYWTPTKNHEKFFAKGEAPQDAAGRRAYARESIAAFAKRAFRRPADERTLDRLVNIAEGTYSQAGKSFEQGVARALVAVISSPRFLFRIERSLPVQANEPYAQIDEYSLASRLSYFMWATMPDEELFGLAERGELRKNLSAQVKRLIGDARSHSFVENFTGQWLQARDVDGISIDARLVLARDNGTEKELQKEFEEFRKRLAERDAAIKAGQPLPPQTKRPKRIGDPAVQLDGELRRAMRLEPELCFEYIVREDRSVAELIDCDYTFLNEKLAKHYGVPGVSGKEMRRVMLPKDSPRGGLITMGCVLVVTSNPTRTSPVKRGIFVLDNILGTPALPPPAAVPALEEAEKNFKDREPSLREMLAVHRENTLCRSCHARMDPLGLSLENFNAMGMWREKERGQAIDAAGTLPTGEPFNNARELKKQIREHRVGDFYRCLTEKVMTYALGRGLESSDADSVDRIVERLRKNDGRFSALLDGVIESAPFQQRRIGVK